VRWRPEDDRRRDAISRLTPNAINGIDFLEVVDDPAQADAARQRTLLVQFIHPVQKAGQTLPGSLLTPDNVVIRGGDRIRDPRVTSVAAAGRVLSVGVDRAGDFSTYTLALRTSVENDAPPQGFDPILSSVAFSFKAACPSDTDCAPAPSCGPQATGPAPEIDYLSRDYEGFRQLMLDRLSVLAPGWTERNPADVGVAVVEVLAYVGDYLSYRQDAVATEAYLGTARLRTSVRRHARLVDYAMHDGCNARAWVQVQPTSGADVPLPAGTQLLTRLAGRPRRITGDFPVDPVTGEPPEVFETCRAATLRPDLERLRFYGWGAPEACLARGATRATLRGDLTARLAPGDALLLHEVLGPHTGEPGDADTSRRHVVVLTRVAVSADPIGQNLEGAAGKAPKPLVLTEIEWGADDALPFPLCLSSRTDLQHGEAPLADVSVAAGNLVLADHGRTRARTAWEVVPPHATRPTPSGGVIDVPARFRPALPEAPLTFAAPLDFTSAGRAVQTDPQTARAAVRLQSPDGGWQPVADLLGAGPDYPGFVVEAEDDGSACLRFGDDDYGLRPEPGTLFDVRYRIGTGTAGNVGTGAIAHVYSEGGTVADRIARVWNPLPARGGTSPESLEHVRQSAPVAFRTQRRAVTPADYARFAEKHPGVQKAAATFRWTGSWRTVFVTVDRVGGLDVDPAFEDGLRAWLEPFRMAGHDLEVDGPRFVPVELEVVVTVHPDHFAEDVREAVRREFGRGTLPGGQKAFFHPDHFTFGQPVFLSRVYAAAQAVHGVQRVQVTTLRRQGQTTSPALDSGRLEVGRLEIARLDDDPNHRERGLLRVLAQGGK
jgi:hypothetical protein